MLDGYPSGLAALDDKQIFIEGAIRMEAILPHPLSFSALVLPGDRFEDTLPGCSWRS